MHINKKKLNKIRSINWNFLYFIFTYDNVPSLSKAQITVMLPRVSSNEDDLNKVPFFVLKIDCEYFKASPLNLY